MESTEITRLLKAANDGEPEALEAVANWRMSLGPGHSNIGVGLSNLGQV